MFCLKHWNSATWTEIPNTETFLRTLKEQMENKTRVKDKALSMKLSFGWRIALYVTTLYPLHLCLQNGNGSCI